jgi:hypothetical protein
VTDSGSSDYEALKDSVEYIMYSDDLSDEELKQSVESVMEYGDLSIASHLYGLCQREKQFDDLHQAYSDFYIAQSLGFREKRRDEKLHGLMEAYRDYFGPGSNEQWNEGVRMGSGPMKMLGAGNTGRLSKDELRDILDNLK